MNIHNDSDMSTITPIMIATHQPQTYTMTVTYQPLTSTVIVKCQPLTSTMIATHQLLTSTMTVTCQPLTPTVIATNQQLTSNIAVTRSNIHNDSDMSNTVIKNQPLIAPNNKYVLVTLPRHLTEPTYHFTADQ